MEERREKDGKGGRKEEGGLGIEVGEWNIFSIFPPAREAGGKMGGKT